MIIGITGMPTVGKDTFFKYFTEWEYNQNHASRNPYRISFADAIRDDLEGFVSKHYGFDIQTCTGKEKEIIRPLLIAHGFAMRQLIPNHWIDQTIPIINDNLNNGRTPVFTDVRYLNEIKLIQKSGGIVVHLTRNPSFPFPEVDSNELIEGFELADLTFELRNMDMNQMEYDLSEDYIHHHKAHFKTILDALSDTLG